MVQDSINDNCVSKPPNNFVINHDFTCFVSDLCDLRDKSKSKMLVPFPTPLLPSLPFCQICLHSNKVKGENFTQYRKFVGRPTDWKCYSVTFKRWIALLTLSYTYIINKHNQCQCECEQTIYLTYNKGAHTLVSLFVTPCSSSFNDMICPEYYSVRHHFHNILKGIINLINSIHR